MTEKKALSISILGAFFLWLYLLFFGTFIDVLRITVFLIKSGMKNVKSIIKKRFLSGALKV